MRVSWHSTDRAVLSFRKRKSDPSVLKDMTCNLVSGQIGSVLDFEAEELALHLAFKEQQRYNKCVASLCTSFSF
jgi:hypothetical protein